MGGRTLFVLLFVAICGASSLEVPDCPSEGVAYLPHEDCTKYYVCDNGFAVEQLCPLSLYFNPSIEQCDFPENVVECVGGTRPPGGNGTTAVPPTTPPSNTTNPTPPSNSTTPTPPSNSTTPTPPSNSTTPTPPSNSTTPTPPSNSTTPTPPSNSTTPTPPSNSTTPTPPSNSTTPPPTNSTSPPGNGTTPLPNGCPADGIDKIPHPSLCDTYFICVDGVPYEEHCADGLQFNPIIKECDFPENVNCTSPGIPTTTPIPVPDCPAEGVHFLPYPRNCSLYYICVEGFPVLNRCADGTLFDPINLQCDLSANVNCTSGNSTFVEEFDLPISNIKLQSSPLDSQNECPSGVTRALIPSSNSCREYFICFDGSNLGTLECPSGFHFDYFSQACVPQGLSTCLL
ncbi:unnamed protein product [Orchesella dallaii]|uniref:Chitin-binding type-2 domain-containing protein n=1 Tax=Orchesella dallaii TaxID=48710 RepID=A0ABP1QQ32_9HEXA